MPRVPDERPASRQQSAISPRLIAGLVLIAAVVVFCFENTARTRIRFLIPWVTVPLWVALFASMLVGVAAGVLISRRRD